MTDQKSVDTDMLVHITMLGQVGVILKIAQLTIVIDPYLSNSVAEKESPDLLRLIEIPFIPSELVDVDYILITHEHRDHCDIDTLAPLLRASTNAKVIANHGVLNFLRAEGIDESRLIAAATLPLFVDADVVFHMLPSAHPVVASDGHGAYKALGFIVEVNGHYIYHCGDTAVNKEVIDAVRVFEKIDIGFIPVNEHNYYRGVKNILGNMSVREAFQFAEDVNIEQFVPTHWDMFEANQVFPEEIELLYEKLSPPFSLSFNPRKIHVC
ncbi:MAG: MBL fold metallo-hydrolase [Oceanicoccus sp.]